jgi:5'-nucleotidase/UDP-sugar diphosphatase
LSHLHSKNAALVQKNKDVDISIGGGNDIAGRPTIINDVQYLVNPGKHGEALTQVNVMTFDGKVTGLVYNQIFLTNAYEEDPGVKAIVDDYNARIDAAMDVTIGYNAQNLEWSTAMVRTMNSPIANLVTDGLKAFFEADGAQLCIVNGGGIRAKLDEGEVTIREVTSVLPFDNNMMLVETSGKTIWAALANGISAYPASNGKFPQVSGMSYSFKAGEKNELVAVTLDNGESLDLNARYKVVINSFIAGGGDGYTMFNVLDSTKEGATDVKQLVFVNKTYMRDALLAYFEKNSSKDSPLVVDKSESRITIL